MDLRSYPIDLSVFLVPAPHCPDDCNFVVRFEIRNRESCALFSFKIARLLWVPCVFGELQEVWEVYLSCFPVFG